MSPEAVGYRAPPIAEALVELRFRGGRAWDEALQRELYGRFGTEYSGAPRTGGQLQVAAQVQGAAVLTHGRVAVDVLFLPCPDGRAVVGIGAGRLSVHALEPYPGWAAFRPRIERALGLWWEGVAPEGITFVSVRYIDRVKIPEGAGMMHDYFPILPGRPERAPASLRAFHVVTQAHDDALDYGAVLTLASAPPEPGLLVTLYDLNVFRERAERPIARDEVMEHVEFLHDRQKSIFEDSITDRTRGLFR